MIQSANTERNLLLGSQLAWFFARFADEETARLSGDPFLKRKIGMAKRTEAIRKTQVRGSSPYNQVTARTMYAAKSTSFGLDGNSTTLNFSKTENLQPTHTDIQIEETT